MSVTQSEIAAEVGLDVSSVNKILNRVKSAVFRRETIAKVFRIAKRRGYDFRKARKGALEALAHELFPRDLRAEDLAAIRGLTIERAREIKEMLYGEKVA